MKDALEEATLREALTYRLVTAARDALPLLMAAHTTLKDVSPRASGQFLASALRLSIAIDNHENTHLQTIIEDTCMEDTNNGKHGTTDNQHGQLPGTTGRGPGRN